MVVGSVVVFGEADELKGEAALEGLRIITEHLIPGRWEESRTPTPDEMAKTIVFAVNIQEATLKSRSGDPGDDQEDIDNDVYWGGVLPFETRYGTPIPDSKHPPSMPPPDKILNYARPV